MSGRMMRPRTLFCAASLGLAAWLSCAETSAANPHAAPLPKPRFDLVVASLIAGAVLGRALCGLSRSPEHETQPP
jgi:hypothetical protein